MSNGWHTQPGERKGSVVRQERGEMTRSVWRRRGKVIGLVLSIMMLGVWVLSVLLLVRYVGPTGKWGLGMSNGRIGLIGGHGMNPGWTCMETYPDFTTSSGANFAFQLGFGLPGKTGGIHTPSWLPFLTVSLPTAILWWCDRRPKAGFCKVCKCDLTGNVSGTRPECGTAVENASKTSTTTPTDGA